MRRGPARVSLESSANVSLHQRFSQVRAEQTMRTNMAAAPKSVLLLVDSTSSFNLQACSVLQVGVPCASPAVATPPTGRASVWTRLGWRQLGYWTFRNKYGWRARCRRAAFRRAGSSGRPARRRPAASATFRKVAPGGTPPGAARLFRRNGPRGRSRDVLTKTELDAELDSYMARSKTRLDAELDQYMSRSKSRLDAQLEEYMALAGQPLPWWD